MTYSYAGLKAELTADPLGRGYAAMTDAQAATSLNAANIAITVDAPARTVRGFLYEQGKWGAVVSLSLDAKTGVATHDNGLVAARQLVALADQGETINTSIPAVYTQAQNDLSAIAAAGALTTTDVSNVMALVAQSISRAVQIGWPAGISDLDVHAARAM